MTDMTSRERLTAALAGRPVDHVPFSPFLAYVWESFPDDVRRAGQLAFHRRIGADPLWRGAPCPVKQTIPGVEYRTTLDGDRKYWDTVTPVGTLRATYVRSDEGNTYFLVGHPLKTEEDFKTRLWLEEHTRLELDGEPAKAHFAEVENEGLSLGMLIPRDKSAFQSLVEHHVGTEELIYALADFPGTVRALWQAMAANDLAAARLAVESDYTHFITWEDSGTQNYSPAMYSEFIGSQITLWCATLASAGKHYIQHACGHVRDLLAPMRRSGVYAVESLSTRPTGNVTVSGARAALGSTGIIGGVEPVLFLQTPIEKLGAYVEQVIRDASGGPFILANADSCPPGVTVDKYALVAKVARNAKTA